MIAALTLIALALLQAAPTAIEAHSAAWDQAVANKARMTSAPSFIDGPSALLSDAERQQGHHGSVVVQGIVDIDGRLKEALVKTSSGVAALDARALETARASTFIPAKSADGTALPLVISMPFSLVSYKTKSGGLFEYRCGQFVRDMDWWRSAHPGQAFADHELYKMELGASMLALVQQARGNQAALQDSINSFNERWASAIDLCRRKPDMLQKDAIYR